MSNSFFELDADSSASIIHDFSLSNADSGNPRSCTRSDPKKHQAPPRRLPNGRFMSKTQIELFEQGVSVEEIMRQAAVAECERKRAEIANGGDGANLTPKKKKKKRKKTPSKRIEDRADADSAAVTRQSIVCGNSNSASIGDHSNLIVSQQQQQRSSAVIQQQQQLGSLAAPSCIQIVNGQPVIQARLERIQAPDGTVMTVAVIPADIQNLLRASGFALPQNAQQIQAGPAASNSPNKVLRLPAPSPAPKAAPAPNVVCIDQRYAPIRPKTKRQPVLAAARRMGPTAAADGNRQRVVVTSIKNLVTTAPQKVILPPQLPTERFTFRLAAEDERAVAELADQISRYQAMPKRTKTDDAALVKLEQKRTAILHRAATAQFKTLSGMMGQPSGAAAATGALPTSQTLQVDGVHYAAVWPGKMSASNGIGAERAHTQDFRNAINSGPNTLGSPFIDMPLLERAGPTPMLSPKAPCTREQSADDAQSMAEGRCERARKRLRLDQESVSQPDRATRFLNKVDAAKRLLPYHLYEESERDANERLLAAADSDFRSYIERCRAKMQSLYGRFFKVLNSTASLSSHMDNLITADLMLRDEKQLLEEERKIAAVSSEQSSLQLNAIKDDQMPPVDSNPEVISLDAQEPNVLTVGAATNSVANFDSPAVSIDTHSTLAEGQERPVVYSPVPPAVSQTATGAKDLGLDIRTSLPLSKSLALLSESSTETSTAVLNVGSSVAEERMMDSIVQSIPAVQASALATDPTSSKQHPFLNQPASDLLSTAQAPAPESGSEERIEARISVKVVIRKHRTVDADNRKLTSPTEIYVAESSKDVKGDDLFSVQSDNGAGGTLRVPPLKIRLRCKGDSKSIAWKRNRDGIRFLGLDPSDSEEDVSEDPVLLEERVAGAADPPKPPDQEIRPSVSNKCYGSPISDIGDDDDENSATTTSLGDSGQDEGDVGDLREEREADQAGGRYRDDQRTEIDRSNRENKEIRTDHSALRHQNIKGARNYRSISRHNNEARVERSISRGRNSPEARANDSIGRLQRDSRETNAEPGIPRLKLFKSSNFTSATKDNRLNIASVTSWKRVRVVSSAKHSMDSGDNEASDDDDNESA